MTSSANQVDPFTRPFNTHILTCPVNQAYFQNILHATFQQFLPLRNQPATQQFTQLATQQSTQLVTQLATQPQQEQQAISEDFTESITEKSSNSKVIINTTSQLSKISRQSTKQAYGEFTFYARFLASQHPRFLISFLASLLASLLASPPRYIRHAKDIKATGQGQMHMNMDRACFIQLSRDSAMRTWLFSFFVGMLSRYAKASYQRGLAPHIFALLAYRIINNITPHHKFMTQSSISLIFIKNLI